MSNLNPVQRVCIVLGMICAAWLCFYPPWIQTFSRGTRRELYPSIAHYWIFDPPGPPAWVWNRVGAELKDAAFWHDRIDVPRFLIEFGFIGLATFVVVTSIGPIARNLARAGLILMRAAAALHPLWTRRLITTAVAGIVFLWAGGIAGHMGEQTVEDLGKWVRQKSPDFMPQASNVELGRMVKQKHSGKYNDFVDPQDNVDLQHYIDDAIYGPRRVLNEERKLIGEGGWGIVGALLEAGIILWFVTRTARSVSRDLAAPRPVAKKNVATQTAAMHQGTK